MWGKSKEKMEIKRYIDQTFLKPERSREELKNLLDRVVKYEFNTVYVHPIFVDMARSFLPSHIKVGSVVGFPLGFQSLYVKKTETEDLIDRGANLIDMVININIFKSVDYDYIVKEIGEVKDIIGKRELKVIIETGVLSKEEIKRVCELLIDGGADYVKTSTGFYKGGAEEEVVRYIKGIVKGKIRIKASGGIRDYSKVINLIKSGAERIGTSAGFDIIDKYYKYYNKEER